MNESLSIIIVNYNGARFLENCIRSYQAFLIKNNIEHEFLIIDNASTDNSIELIEELMPQFQNIRLERSNINHGFGKANNILVEQARYQNIVLLNNDTLTVDISELCKMAKESTIDSNTVYTCNILNSDKTMQKNTFNFPRLFNVTVEVFLIKKPLFGIYKFFFKNKLTIEDGYFSGCYLVMNKDLFEKAGGFDKDFFFYHEECDLFLRLEKIGIKKKILSDRIIHYGSGGAGISDFAFKNYYLNLARLLIKHHYGSPNFIKSIFNISFKFRNALMALGIKIPYSPFSHIYQKNKAIVASNAHLINLHKETLAAINKI